MSKRRPFPPLALLVVALLTSATAHSAGAPSTNIVLGLLLPPEESQSASLRDGAQLALDQANKAGGAHVSLVVRGRVGQWGADAVEAGRMVLDDAASALISPPDGSASHLALQVSGRTAVPVVTLCPDASVSSTGVPWFLRVVPRTADEAAVIFTNLNSGPNPLKHWVAVVPPDRAGREIIRDLKQAASDAGCVLEKTFELAATNRTSVMNQVLKTNAPGVLLWLDPLSAGACVKVLKLAHFSGAVAGPTRLHTPEFVAAAGEALDGFVLPGVLLDAASQKRFEAFQTVFRHQFKREPDVLAAFSFDAAALLIQVLRQTAPEALPKAFPLSEPMEGVTGELTFDSHGNRKLSLRLLQVEAGQFLPVPKQNSN
jgi:branched-chain amino acid transport system substrate-binding protein